MDDVTVECAWNGCGQRATCIREDDMPLCDRHDLLADRLQAIEAGFVVGLGLGIIHDLVD